MCGKCRTISYNPAQVLKLAGKRYLTGPVIFYRTDGHSTIVSLTVEDIYRFQTYLESHSTTLINHNRKTLEFYHKKKGNPKPDPEAVSTPKPKEDNAA